MKNEFQQFTEVSEWDQIQQDLQEWFCITIAQMMSDHDREWSWVNAVILPSEGHKALNSKYLEHDYATDVLTFDMSEEGIVSGEVYVDAEVMDENAHRFSVTRAKEYQRMVVHGVLHLLGFDDATEEQRAHMVQLENKYLD